MPSSAFREQTGIAYGQNARHQLDVYRPTDTPISTQPIHFASSAAPPSMLLTGERDDLVDPGNSARLAARLQQHSVPARVIAYPGLGHRTLIGALAPSLHALGAVLDDVAGFISQRTAG